MRHPEVLLVPVLMMLDYYLTLFGLRLGEQAYLRHFKIPHYELNPLWQAAIVRRQWFNRWHACAVVVVGGMLVLLTEVLNVESTLLNLMLGYLLASYGVLLSQHLANVLTFSHLIRRPDEVAGEIRLAQTYLLALSIHQLLPVAAPLALVAIFAPSEFVFGALAGVLMMALMKTVWLARTRRRSAKEAVTKPAT